MRTNQQHPTIRTGHHQARLVLLLGAGVLASGPALAGGLLGYEIGTADVGLASAGWGVLLPWKIGFKDRIEGANLSDLALRQDPWRDQHEPAPGRSHSAI